MTKGNVSMSGLLEERDACLPITAIRPIKLAGTQFVLSGVGPYILLIDENTGSLLDRLRIFERNAVHGLKIIFSNSLEAGKSNAKILVWGGQSICAISLDFHKLSPTDGVKNPCLSVIRPEFLCPDWILDADVRPVPQIDETTPVHRFAIVLITAHNVLLCAEFQDEPDEVFEAGPFRLYEVDARLKPVLFSADVKWISPTRILVAAGTVFGEIIVWSCRIRTDNFMELPLRRPVVSIHHFFTGHEGSIFGVDISQEILVPGKSEPERFLASCSDDRTVRVWNISLDSSKDYDPTGLSMDRNARGTGFGTYIGELNLNQDACLARVWTHEARIWGVHFLEDSLAEDRLSLKLVSRSEDATCRLWNLTASPGQSGRGGPPAPKQATLTLLQTFRYHTGKHVWSCAVRINPTTYTLYSGGADGNLFSFFVDRHESRAYGEQKWLYTNDQILGEIIVPPSQTRDTRPAGQHKKEKRGHQICKYAFVSDDCLISTSSEGRVILGHIRDARSGPVVWETITTIKELTSYCFIASDARRGVAVIGSKTGELWLYDHRSKSIHGLAQVDTRLAAIFILDAGSSQSPSADLLSFIVTFADSSKLVWLQYRIHDRSAVSRSDFEPPSNFVVTSTGFIEESSQMILGSREGVIALYDVGDTSDPGFGPALLCVRDAHDREAVTSILTFKFPGDSQPPQTHILTTGRDCYYSLHKIKTPKDTSPTLEIETVHRSSPPTRIVLEGASMDPSTGVLILTGFRGVHFVVWNESTQTELVAVDCGGGHRTWVHHSGMDGSFLVWTRAGNLNIFSRTDSAYRALRVGGHGREVKTMAISPSIGTGGEINRTILATGSEDTCIRLFLLDEEPRSRPCGSFQSVRTLKPSNTGLQHLQWSSDARWLFSSAGNEDFDTWRVRYMPGFGIGVVREGNYPKSQAISELRITHFEAVEVDVGETDMDAFLIFMGYSNSEVKVFYFTSNCAAFSYTLLAQGRYSSNCITHIRFLPSGSTPYLISTATDGRLAKWSLESALSGFSVSADRVKQKSPSSLSLSPIPLTWETRHQIHQSSVKAVAFYSISQDTSLIISGGDDNGLSVSIFTIPSPAGVRRAADFATISLPDAHASAINDIAIIRAKVSRQAEPRLLEVVAASSGNDQRLKIWSIQVDISDQDIEAGDVRVLLKEDVYTPVADLNCMAGFTTSRSAVADEAEWRLVLGGVGMEMWSVRQ